MSIQQSSFISNNHGVPGEQMESEYGWFWKRLESYLSKHGLKNTKQRHLITEYIISMPNHIDVEELYGLLSKNGHDVGLATVYRTVSLLKSAGLLEPRYFSDGKSTYEIVDPEEHHDHLICSQCDKVVEFVNPEIERLQEQVAQDHGFQLHSHFLNLYGKCRDCQEV